MEYIQCTNCDKKYAANDKVRPFVGREITCKACGEKFPITILNTNIEKEEETNSSPPETEKTNGNLPEHQKKTASQSTDNKQEKIDPIPDEKNKGLSKEKLQLYITLILGISLVAAIAFLVVMDTPSTEQAAKETIHYESTQTIKEIETDTEVKVRTRSLACKKEAAKQWLIDSKMIHGQNSNAEYLDLINKSQEQSERLRAVCDDSTDVQRVLQSATEQHTLPWFESQIKVVEYESFDLPFADIHAKPPKKL